MDWRSVAAVGLVVVAGCNGVAFGDGGAGLPTETLTPAPVETARSTTVAADRPPGVSGGQVAATELLVAHERYLEARGDSFTWVVTERAVSDRHTEGYTQRLRVDGDAFLLEYEEWGDRRNVSLYVANRTGYLRVERTRETELEIVDDVWPHDRYEFAGQVVGRYLTGGVTVRTVERRGEVLYQVHSAQPGPGVGMDGARETVSRYAATAYVTPEGFVRTMLVSYNQTIGETTRQTRIRFDYRAVGETTVSRPGWVARVPGPSRWSPVTPDETTTAQNTTAPTPGRT